MEKKHTTTASSPKLDLHPVSATPGQWFLIFLIATSVHVACGAASALFGSGGASSEAPAPPILSASMPAHEYAMPEDVEETPEVSYEVEEKSLGLDGPVIADEVIVDEAEGDNDLPFDESFGESEGNSDAPFEGPSPGGVIGIGGGAGGAFKGRGGSADRGHGGRSQHTRTRREEPCTWKRSTLVPHTSRIKIGDDEEIPLAGMHATVHIEGFRARVLLDCFYQSTHKRRLEGTFQIRLPNEASPYYFAFGETRLTTSLRGLAPKGGFSVSLDAVRSERRDAWTAPKEARMVPRARAARAYEQVVRRRVDPALLEWSGADMFNARVFPLEPGKLHRIVLGYEVNLTHAQCYQAYELELPEAIPELMVDLHVRDPLAKVSPRGPALDGHYRYWNPSARRFSVRIPHQGPTVLHGEDAATGEYFAMRYKPKLGATAARTSPRAVFLVDVSLSSRPDRMNVWVELLSEILTKNRPQIREFAVGFFDVATTWWRKGFTPNSEANVRALLAHARTRALQGATDLHQALKQAGTRQGSFDVFLLSDGAVTWGEDDDDVLRQALGEGHQLFAYRTGFSGTDGARLDRLARATGGAVFSVTGQGEVAKAAVAHRSMPWRIRGISVEGGHDLLLAGRPRTIYPGQSVLLVGRGLPRQGAPIELEVARGRERRVVRTTPARFIDSELAPRVFGQVAVGQLEQVRGITPNAVRAYATHFRVVGKTCSLLMLESEADYRRFGIVPKNDAAVIQRSEARLLLKAAAQSAPAAPGGPKARFLEQLTRIQRDAGVSDPLPTGLQALLADVAPEALTIDSKRLSGTAVRRGTLPKAYAEMLWRPRVTYTEVVSHAAQLAREKSGAAALHALSSLVEQSPGDLVLLRDIAAQAQSLGFGGHAYHLLRRAARARPHEAQNLTTMALGLARAGKPIAALLCYEAVLHRPNHQGRSDLRRCASFDYAFLLQRIVREDAPASVKRYATRRLQELQYELGIAEADLIVTIGWSTDRTDVDLHVTEPTKEVCYYDNRKTKLGGRITRDIRDGYGPETYVLQTAVKGIYQVHAKYYASDRNRTSARTRVHVRVYRNWGRAGATVQERDVLLQNTKDRQQLMVLKK